MWVWGVVRYEKVCFAVQEDLNWGFTYLEHRLHAATLLPACVFSGVCANATCRPGLYAYGGFAFAYLGRRNFSRREGPLCRREGYNRLCGSSLHLIFRSSLHWAIEIGTVQGRAGVGAWRRSATLFPALHCNVVRTVARSRIALDAHHLFALTSWNEGSVRECWT